MRTDTHMRYYLIDAPGHDNNNEASVISKHKTAEAALKAAKRYNRNSEVHKVVAIGPFNVSITGVRYHWDGEKGKHIKRYHVWSDFAYRHIIKGDS